MSDALTCLADLMPIHLDEEPRRDQRAWLDDGSPIILQCSLSRTAVIRRLPDAGERELVAHQRVYVDAETLVWARERFVLVMENGVLQTGGPTMRERRLRGRETARKRKMAAKAAESDGEARKVAM